MIKFLWKHFLGSDLICYKICLLKPKRLSFFVNFQWSTVSKDFSNWGKSNELVCLDCIKVFMTFSNIPILKNIRFGFASGFSMASAFKDTRFFTREWTSFFCCKTFFGFPVQFPTIYCGKKIIIVFQNFLVYIFSKMLFFINSLSVFWNFVFLRWWLLQLVSIKLPFSA